VVQALAKELGITESAVKDMVAAGKVGFPELERAFASMTGPGGQFEGMMENLSQTTMGKFSTAMDNGRMALASFGELMLPMANDLLEAASDIFQGLSDMDEGTKRFIIGFGGVSRSRGPRLWRSRALTRRSRCCTKIPIFWALRGCRGRSLIAGEINKQAHAYEDLNTQIQRVNDEADGIIQSFSGGNREKKLDETTTRELIRLYPELATEMKAYETSAGDAADAIKALREQKVLDAAASQIDKLRRETEAVRASAEEYDRFNAKKDENIRRYQIQGDYEGVLQVQEALVTHQKHGTNQRTRRPRPPRRSMPRSPP
jgi:hypothetical protein